MNQNNTNISTAPAPDPAIEAIELPLLLEAIYRRYGYDFRDYVRASRLASIISQEGVATISAYQPSTTILSCGSFCAKTSSGPNITW